MEERKIADNIRNLVGVMGFDTMLCTVLSVDGETCTVKTVRSGSEYKNIKLNANINDDKGIYIFPKKDSYVLVTMTDKVQGFVSMYSDIEKVTLKIDDTVEIEAVGDVKLKCDGNIEVNGGDNKGMVKVKDLTDKINAIEDKVNSLLSTLKSVSVVLAPAGTFPFAPIFSAITPLVKTQQKEIENTKITH